MASRIAIIASVLGSASALAQTQIQPPPRSAVPPARPVARPVAPPSRPLVVPPPSRLPDYDRLSRQQQVRDQLQKNQLEEQIRQTSSQTMRQPVLGDPAQQQRLEQSDEAQRQRARARDQDAVDRYRDSTAPGVPPPSRQTPAPARSGG
ncbi:hypothetical protein [Aerosticca soli]|uniref:Uncharacterized protein n=1 Tax=Aerosticca soli TaxID=2010829 RepID=A0A2Z6E715_9GAMM|nr:hypothetical protein [Aerosticca soli]MDI3261356.1 hypothetical protein [Fulvimonas sp.]BBD80474.1 hypothetical protein ALSL_1827 [Aerosticca soli]